MRKRVKLKDDAQSGGCASIKLKIISATKGAINIMEMIVIKLVFSMMSYVLDLVLIILHYLLVFCNRIFLHKHL